MPPARLHRHREVAKEQSAVFWPKLSCTILHNVFKKRVTYVRGDVFVMLGMTQLQLCSACRLATCQENPGTLGVRYALDVLSTFDHLLVWRLLISAFRSWNFLPSSCPETSSFDCETPATQPKDPVQHVNGH